MKWCALVFFLIPYVSALLIIPLGNVSAHSPFKLLLVIKATGNVMLELKLNGAKLPNGSSVFSWNGVVNGEKYLTIEALAISDIIKIEYKYNDVIGVGYIGKVPYPCSFVEIKPRATSLSLTAYNSCKKKVPLIIHFQYAYPSKEIVVKRCVDQEVKSNKKKKSLQKK